MNNFFLQLLRLILFVGFQVLVLNNVPPLHQFIVPYLYYLFLLWLPLSVNRVVLLLAGFVLGISCDYFSGTLGIHAAPCVLIAYIRPLILNLVIQLDGEELNYSEPCIKGMGFLMYSIYVIFMTLIHHSSLILLEWLQFGNVYYFLGKVFATSMMSFVLIFILELFFYNRGWKERGTARL